MALIYLVEDDESIREIETIALKNSNYIVSAFENAKEFFSDTMAEPVTEIYTYLSKSKSARMRLQNPPVYKPKKAKKKGLFSSMMNM